MSRFRSWWALALAFVLTLGLELALVERKYGVFGGGFGASHVVDTPGEWALFLPALLLAHGLLVGGLFLLIRALHRRNRDTPLFLLNFLFVALALLCALLAAKYELLRYFSDAIGFELIRNLGGGSLTEALLYMREEAMLPLLVAAGILAAYWICRRLVKRWAMRSVEAPRFGWKALLGIALLLVGVAFAANGEPDARHALMRTNAFGVADRALQTLTDFDRDGWGWFGAKIDPHPFDPARHPLALDVPNNSVDEDGIGGDFRFAGEAPPLAVPKLPEKKRHLVLIVLESTRGDALGRRVAGREVTPALNALAREGSVGRGAYSHVGFTTESLKSLFSGTLSPEPGGPSLFQDLKANGYHLGVLSSQAESWGEIDEVVGSRRHADRFIDAEVLKDERVFSFATKASLKVDGRSLLREFGKAYGNAEAWKRPNFLYFNFQEAHFPYYHRGMPQILPGSPIPRGEIGPGNRDWVAATYWNAVAFDDWLVGQVVNRLKALGIWEETLLVVTADHGESLFDDDFLGHGHVINRQQTHVPLIVSAPGVSLPAPIGLSDYRPLILGLLGAKVPAPPPGRVFQYIGELDTPHSIGIVEPGDKWTIMTVGNEMVSFGETGRHARYADLAAGSDEKKRADRLILEWERQRWIAHLARGKR